MPEYLLLCVIVCFAGAVQGLTGFGSLLVAVPLLSLFIAIKTVIPLGLLLALVINTTLMLQLRRHVDWRVVAPLLLATAPGIPAGVWVLKTLPGWTLTAALGLTCAGFGLYSLLRAPAPRKESARGWAWLAGFLAGCMGGSLGTNGPPIIIFAAAQPWEPRRAKACMSAYFFVSTVAIVGMHVATGVVTDEVLRLFATALPDLVVGIGAGMLAFSRLGERGYRRFVLLLVLALGLMLLWRAWGASGV